MKWILRILKVISEYPYLIAIGVTLLISTFFIFYNQFKAEVHYTQVPNGKIAYYIRGETEGAPLFLIEGFGMSMEDWDPSLIRSLSQHNRVIVYDLRGVGLSTGDVKNVTVEDMASDTIDLANSLGIKKFSILGWSMGSLVAQELATTYSEKVDKVILVSTFTNDENTIDSSANNSAYIQNNLGMSFEDLFDPVLFTPDTIGNRYREEYFTRRKNAIKSGEAPKTNGVSVETKISQEEALAKMSTGGSRLSKLARIKNPTLIMVGDSDQLLASKNSEIVAKTIPHSQLKIIKHSGHAVLFQNTNEVKEAISEFLHHS